MEKRKIGENLEPMEALIKRIKVTISLLIFFAFCPLFFLCKCTIYLILRIKYGKRFHGIMTGNDLIWSIEDNSKSIVTSLIIFDYNKERNGDIFEAFYKHVSVEYSKKFAAKLRMRRKQFMGYTYYLENEFDLSWLRKMDDYENWDDIRELLGKYSNEPMGVDNDGFLEILVGRKPISFNKETNLEQYPLIFKLHHSLGDGVSLLNLLVASMAENPGEFLSNSYTSFVKKQKAKTVKTEFNLGKILTKLLKIGIYFFPIYAKSYECKVHGPVLSGKKHLVWKNESEGYIQKIKATKNRIQGCTFTSILFAAISASLSEFFEKNHPDEIPSYIRTNMIILPRLPKFQDLVTIRNNQIENVTMNNKFTVCTLNIPLSSSVKQIDKIVQSLSDVKQELDQLASSLDYYVNKFFISYFSSLPPRMVINYFMKYFGGALAISYLPGLDKMKMFHGDYLQDLFFWIPNHKKTGLGVSIITYDNRFEIGMIADDVLLKSKDLQEILDNVYKHIDILHEESKHRKYLR